MHRLYSKLSTLGQQRKSRPLLRCVGAALLSGLVLSLPAQASLSDRRVATERFTEYAKVINVEPVFRDVQIREPRQECWTEHEDRVVGYERTTRYQHPQANSQRRNTGNAIIGGLIGGVIGNQLGRGHSRHSRAGATVAGAIIGGAIGNEARGEVSRHRRHQPSRQVDSRPIYESTPVERCRRVNRTRSESQLQHYNVTYRYKGRNFLTQLPRDPGKRLELQVTVAPARH